MAVFQVFILGAVCAVAFALGGCGGPAIGSVGALFGKDIKTGRLFVREVPPDMAAASAGVREGDEVIAVDGAPVGELSPANVHQRMVGVVGTKVVLLVVRNGETLKLEVVRGPLEKAGGN